MSDTVGVLRSLLESDWLSVAEELAELSPSEFALVLSSFEDYRRAVQAEKVKFPARPSGASMKGPSASTKKVVLHLVHGKKP